MVSIIMPAYNAGKFIKEAIQSVLNQTYTNWELLIINDGSSDNTDSIVKQFDDARIKYFFQENAGVSAARNKGLREMVGEFFCFLDADDIFLPRSIESRLEVFAQEAHIAFVDGAVEEKNETLATVVREYVPKFKGEPLKKLIALSSDCFLGNTWMIKRKPGHEYQFQKGLTHGEDRFFYIHIAHHGTYSFTKELVLIYRKRVGSAMTNLDGLQNGYENLYTFVKQNIKGVTLLELAYLKYKISRIMFLSNVSAKRPQKALLSLVKNLTL